MIYEDLAAIQQNLNAPKGQHNGFGNYDYRSCEDILSALKPLLKNYVVLLNDEIVQVGERYYVKATATFTDGKETIERTAFAREEQDKKGMDASQITGSTSSYARKYALNALFAIDDTKDADATNKHEKTTQVKQTPTAAPENTRFCSVHGEVMTMKISQKTGKPYYSHLFKGANCFGSPN